MTTCTHRASGDFLPRIKAANSARLSCFAACTHKAGSTLDVGTCTWLTSRFGCRKGPTIWRGGRQCSSQSSSARPADAGSFTAGFVVEAEISGTRANGSGLGDAVTSFFEALYSPAPPTDAPHATADLEAVPKARNSAGPRTLSGSSDILNRESSASRRRSEAITPRRSGAGCQPVNRPAK